MSFLFAKMMGRRNLLKFLIWGIGAIIVIAPFYAPLTVWAASGIQHFDFLKIWKEIALSALAVILLSLMMSSKTLWTEVVKNRLLVLMGIYALLLILVGAHDLISHNVADKAVIYGWLIDIRPVGFFALVYLSFAGNRGDTNNFPWKRLVLIPASLVVVFGLLQFTVLPKDILTHIGYGKATILPYQTVDNQSNFARVQSTLRGPNPLGAYLVLIITMIASLTIRAKGRHKLAFGIFGVGSLIVLFGTYSRSAEVGLVLSLAVLLIAYQKRFIRRRTVFFLTAGLLFVVGASLVALRQNYTAQNLIFHSSQKSSSSVSSNAERTSALENGALDVIHHPFGGGVGSAGPASLRNDHPARIAEDYYLQIGQEVGVLGMLLFIAINILVGFELWKLRDQMLPRILLASLVGLTFINLVSHAWADDTISYQIGRAHV